MNFMLIGRVYYEGGCGNPDCCGKTCQDISEPFEANGAGEAIEQAKAILKRKVAPSYSKLDVKLYLAEIVWTLESSPVGRNVERPTMYVNLLG